MRFLFTILFFIISFNLTGQNNKVEILKISELNDLISNRGEKILLINIWATWCIPCREEFPDLVRLHKEFNNRLDVVALSVDYEDEIDSKIVPFLKENNVKFQVYVNGIKKDEELINFFNNKWNGALPATFIYNKDGFQIEFLEGKQSYESFSSLIRKQLK